MYAPSKPGDQPSVEVSKEFIMSPSKLHLECSLDKELYHHGEKISVNVHIQNNSNKAVKKIRVCVRQSVMRASGGPLVARIRRVARSGLVGWTASGSVAGVGALSSSPSAARVMSCRLRHGGGAVAARPLGEVGSCGGELGRAA